MRKEQERDLDRRHPLNCMAWVGTGAAWTRSGGVLKRPAPGTFTYFCSLHPRMTGSVVVGTLGGGR